MDRRLVVVEIEGDGLRAVRQQRLECPCPCAIRSAQRSIFGQVLRTKRSTFRSSESFISLSPDNVVGETHGHDIEGVETGVLGSYGSRHREQRPL